MKKLIKTLPVLLIMVALICTLCGFNYDEEKVFDEADLFTDSEEESLKVYALETADELELDIIIHTTNSTDGLDIVDYTYEFYEENDFGYDGEDGAGIILVIDMGNRELFIYESQPEEVNFLFLDSELDVMIDEISPYLSSGDYYDGALQFINMVSAYADYDDADEDAYDGTGDVVYNTDGKRQSQVDFSEIMVRLVISAIIATIAVVIMSINQKSKKVTNPHVYMRDGKLDMREHSDIYTHTTTVKHRINTDNGGGGGGHGGGGHSGGSFSGGGSHGHGRGGGF